uniref:Uncharacterized protein n=1 Tax=Anopheles culicifacies TaxID=139723 RepID=A0A182LZJ2_9DIPT
MFATISHMLADERKPQRNNLGIGTKMPQFDDSFLFDCASFERKIWKKHNLRYQPTGVVPKSAGNLNPLLDVDIQKFFQPSDDGSRLLKKAFSGYAPNSLISTETSRGQDAKQRKRAQGSLGLRRQQQVIKMNLFSGSNSATYDVFQKEQVNQRVSTVLRGQQFQHKNQMDRISDDGDASRYDSGGNFTTSNNSSNIGLTSTPISSGCNSNGNSKGGGAGSTTTSPTVGAANDQNSSNSSSGTNTTVTPGAPGSSGHKGSIRGNKLARRARSFKDDFLEKISQIRTPTNTMTSGWEMMPLKG